MCRLCFLFEILAFWFAGMCQNRFHGKSILQNNAVFKRYTWPARNRWKCAGFAWTSWWKWKPLVGGGQTRSSLIKGQRADISYTNLSSCCHGCFATMNERERERERERGREVGRERSRKKKARRKRSGLFLWICRSNKSAFVYPSRGGGKEQWKGKKRLALQERWW